jgi:hypothetical protein
MDLCIQPMFQAKLAYDLGAAFSLMTLIISGGGYDW